MSSVDKTGSDTHVEQTENSPLSEILKSPLRAKPRMPVRPERQERKEGVVIGEIFEISESGYKVNFSENPDSLPLEALSTVNIENALPGEQVALSFINGNLRQPVILGVIKPTRMSVGVSDQPMQIEVDGERQIVHAEKQLVLRCGDASIVLNRDGRIVVKGAYVETRSRGVNRIKGGSVQIN